MGKKTTIPRLAIDGGDKVRTRAWPARKLFAQREKKAVMALFDRAMKEGSHLLGYNGEQEENYGKEFAAFLGGGFADGVNSGTNGIYVALRSFYLEPFSEVIVPCTTDCGGFMPVPLMNCIPVVADCAPGSYNMGIDQIAARVTERTRAIVVPHIAGIPVDMDPIMDLARARGIRVIEDCAQAHGATYKGRPAGTIGDIGVFSTMFGKHHATAGQGGMVFTKSEELYWRIRQLADRGKPFGLPAGRSNVAASLNFNMTELAATIGRVQLQRLPKFVAQRRRMAGLVERGLRQSTKTMRLVTPSSNCEGAYWFLLIRIQPERLKIDRHALVEAVKAEGVPLDEGYWRIPALMEWYQNKAVFGTSGLPWTAEQYRGSYRGEPPDLTNITATEARHVTIFDFWENWTEREAQDLVAALAKVEKAYLR